MLKNSPRFVKQAFYIKTFSVLIIFCLGTLVYSNIFSVPFQFDDAAYVVNNLAIRNIHNLSNIWKFCPCRFVTFFSLAFNYHFHQLNVFGYHLFNLAIHLGTAFFVWWLTLLTFSTPVMKGEKIASRARTIALFAGLVFVSHPLQTEAVTYIWQRAASMATLFYVASLCFYVKSRLLSVGEGSKPSPTSIYYTLSLITAVVAMFTKENAVTLPLMILLYDFSFLKTEKNLNWSSLQSFVFNQKYLFPFLLTLLIIPLTMLLTKSARFQEIRSITWGIHGISPGHYLLTQLRVMITYIRLVFLPLNQNLDYDYPVIKSIFEISAFFSLLFLIAIFYSAQRLFLKYRLVSFSIFWFFLTLLPESSLLPQRDVIYEHRLYLPLVGYSIFLVSSLYYLLQKRSIKTMVIALVMLIAFNSVLTYQRNKVWNNEITLWDDAARKSPRKARPYGNRGNEYYKRGKFTQAISDFNKAIEIDPNYPEGYNSRGVYYEKQGNHAQSISDFNKAIEINPNYAEAHFNRGILYDKQGDYINSLSDYNMAIELSPNYADAYFNRGVLYDKQGQFNQALSDYDKTIELNPKNTAAYAFRGVIFAKQNDFTLALFNYNKAIELNPDYAEAYFDRAITYSQLKDYANAWSNVYKAEELGYAVNSGFISLLKQVSGRE